MAGGIRGIRALRVQRAAIEEQIAVKDNEGGARAAGTDMDRFERYGGKVAGQVAKSNAAAAE